MKKIDYLLTAIYIITGIFSASVHAEISLTCKWIDPKFGEFELTTSSCDGWREASERTSACGTESTEEPDAKRRKVKVDWRRTFVGSTVLIKNKNGSSHEYPNCGSGFGIYHQLVIKHLYLRLDLLADEQYEGSLGTHGTATDIKFRWTKDDVIIAKNVRCDIVETEDLEKK
jgi:hypothetical protein